LLFEVTSNRGREMRTPPRQRRRERTGRGGHPSSVSPVGPKSPWKIGVVHTTPYELVSGAWLCSDPRGSCHGEMVGWSNGRCRSAQSRPCPDRRQPVIACGVTTSTRGESVERLGARWCGSSSPLRDVGDVEIPRDLSVTQSTRSRVRTRGRCRERSPRWPILALQHSISGGSRIPCVFPLYLRTGCRTRHPGRGTRSWSCR
jgi:hypothetical protein